MTLRAAIRPHIMIRACSVTKTCLPTITVWRKFFAAPFAIARNDNGLFFPTRVLFSGFSRIAPRPSGSTFLSAEGLFVRVVSWFKLGFAVFTSAINNFINTFSFFVKCHVLTSCKQLKILNSIIVFNLVLVMNMLMRLKRTTKMFCHNIAMLKRVKRVITKRLKSCVNRNITIWMASLPTLPQMMFFTVLHKIYFRSKIKNKNYNNTGIIHI